MPPVFNAFVPGNVMLWADVQANLDIGRLYLNDIPNADIATGGIRREHLVRPRIQGFPVEGVEGGAQAAYGRTYGTQQPDVAPDLEWGSLSKRITIIPTASNGVTRAIPTAIAKTFFVWTDNYASFVLSADCQIRANNNVAIHPFDAGPGTQAVGGYFAIHVYDLNANTDTELVGSRRYIYPMDHSNGAGPVTSFHQQQILMYGERHLTTPGWYESQVWYHVDAAASTIDQIDLSRIQLHVEVL